MGTLTVNQNSISHVWYVKEHERTGTSTKTPLQDIVIKGRQTLVYMDWTFKFNKKTYDSIATKHVHVFNSTRNSCFLYKEKLLNVQLRKIYEDYRSSTQPGTLEFQSNDHPMQFYH
jgi:hypothetical protein